MDNDKRMEQLIMKTEKQYLEQISRARQDVNILFQNLVVNTSRSQFAYSAYGKEATSVEHLITGAKQLQAAMNLLDEANGEYADYLFSQYIHEKEAGNK